jgi:hypothetical protein
MPGQLHLRSKLAPVVQVPGLHGYLQSEPAVSARGLDRQRLSLVCFDKVSLGGVNTIAERARCTFWYR